MINKQDIENLIKDLIHKVNVKVNKVDISEDKGAKTWFSVEVSEPHFFINREGEALHALNHLVRRILENKSPTTKDTEGLNFNENILIDINDFQKKRVESIQAVAHMMSERARYFKSSVEVDPMSSFDRRIVHEFLSDATDLKTESVGMGPGRRVVIKYIGTV
jgi:spoIIIJ-associated protein